MESDGFFAPVLSVCLQRHRFCKLIDFLCQATYAASRLSLGRA